MAKQKMLIKSDLNKNLLRVIDYHLSEYEEAVSNNDIESARLEAMNIATILLKRKKQKNAPKGGSEND